MKPFIALCLLATLTTTIPPAAASIALWECPADAACVGAVSGGDCDTRGGTAVVAQGPGAFPASATAGNACGTTESGDRYNGYGARVSSATFPVFTYTDVQWGTVGPHCVFGVISLTQPLSPVDVRPGCPASPPEMPHPGNLLP